MVQILLGHRVHVVAVAGRIEHVAFEHRVVGQARDVDTVSRQHVDVVLAVLRQLGPLRVFEQRLEPRNDQVHRQLVRRAQIIVRQRHVPARAAARCEREAHQSSLVGVETVGFGVEADQLGLRQLVDEPVESVGIHHDLDLRGGRGHGDVGDLVGARCRNSSGFGRVGRRGDGQVSGRRRGHTFQFFAPAMEFELAEQRNQRRIVASTGHQFVDR